MPIPTVVWAQRKDKLYITIDVQDVKDEQISLKNEDGAGVLKFSGKAGKEQTEYQLDMALLHEINVEESKVSSSPRHIFMVVVKVEQGHWPRLTKESGRHLTHIKCDWDKWVDEDEEDEKPEMDLSGMDFSGFGGGGAGGFPGMGGGGFPGMGGGGFPGMGGGGFPGMGGEGFPDLADLQAQGGDDEDDSDDDELPDLVK